MKEWYREWFASDYYLKVYKHRDDSDAENLSNLILSNIELKENSRILDAACGSGRHSNYFSSIGFNVVGFDLSISLLKVAKEESLKKSINGNFLRADIRRIFFRNKFDAVLNLFTSFGYFESDEENFLFPKNIFNSLSNNGYYVLDYLNKVFVLNNLIPYSKKSIDNLEIREERKIVNDRIVKSIRIQENRNERLFYESVKLYSKEKIIENFRKIGYKEHKIFGDYSSGQYDEQLSPRLIILFQK